MRRLRTMMMVNVVLGAGLGALLVALVPFTSPRPMSYWVTLCLPVVLLATPLLGWWQLRRLSEVAHGQPGSQVGRPRMRPAPFTAAPRDP